jgi:prepilin-type N-terminal cleavage/methylation domain-containing protein
MKKISIKLKCNTPHAKKGITLIELIMAIVIAAIILIPLSVVIVESVTHTIIPEHYTIASSLLEREMDRVSALRFSTVANEGPTSYAGSFSNYSRQVSFYYVNAGALNTQVVGPTGYKRVTITISRTGLPFVSAVTLVTDN